MAVAQIELAEALPRLRVVRLAGGGAHQIRRGRPGRRSRCRSPTAPTARPPTPDRSTRPCARRRARCPCRPASSAVDRRGVGVGRAQRLPDHPRRADRDRDDRDDSARGGRRRSSSRLRRTARPTGSASGPRPASQPAQASAGIVTPGKNHVQSMAEWMPNAITTASIVNRPARSAAVLARQSGGPRRRRKPSVRPVAIAHAIEQREAQQRSRSSRSPRTSRPRSCGRGRRRACRWCSACGRSESRPRQCP